jgi:hypothetical protein
MDIKPQTMNIKQKLQQYVEKRTEELNGGMPDTVLCREALAEIVWLETLQSPVDVKKRLAKIAALPDHSVVEFTDDTAQKLCRDVLAELERLERAVTEATVLAEERLSEAQRGTEFVALAIQNNRICSQSIARFSEFATAWRIACESLSADLLAMTQQEDGG